MRRARGRFFIDTNILVYTIDNREPKKQAKAIEIVAEALEERHGIISYQVVQEFLNVATRKSLPPMKVSDAQVYLSRVLMPLCEVYPDTALFSLALTVSNQTGFSFCDSLIAAAAITGGCALLYSEDLQDGRRISHVEIRNPFA